MQNHTFVICAYKKSKYLDACIQSLKKQTLQSKIIMVTSTPNSFIENKAKQHDIPLYINEGEGGITQDWNFGYACADSQYVTIAHQDDIYRKDYLEKAFQDIERANKPLIFFSDYNELRDGQIIKSNTLLNVKRFMLLPLRIRIFQKSVWIRRRILSFGSPICCPSVLYAKNNLPNIIFKNGFRSCEDWEAWEMLSKLTGEFIYRNEPLMYHRIHEESETSAIIGDNARSQEEYVMYCKFWPRFIAKLLNKQYAKGQRSNKLAE